MNANCPHCNSTMSSLRISAVEGRIGGGGYNCIVLACPSCNKAISAQIDPIAIKEDTVDAIRKAY